MRSLIKKIRRLFHVHDWLYRYPRYAARVHAFTDPPEIPDWVDRKCYGCGALEPNKDYQAWLEYVAAVKKQMDYETKKYGHPLLRNITM